MAFLVGDHDPYANHDLAFHPPHRIAPERVKQRAARYDWAMKLPQLTLRDLFWLVLVCALGLGWLISWESLRVNYNSHLNKVRQAHAREQSLKDQILGEQYIAEWDEDQKTYRLTRFEDLTREEVSRRMRKSHEESERLFRELTPD